MMAKTQRKILLFGLGMLALLAVFSLTYVTKNWLFYPLFALLAISVLTVLTQTDLFVIWIVLLGSVIGVFTFFSGIVYLSMADRLVLTLTFPLFTLFLLFLKRWDRDYRLDLKNEEADAKDIFESYSGQGDQRIVYMVLVEWAHFNYYKEIAPKKSFDILTQIRLELLRHLSKREELFYLGSGQFLLFSESPSINDELKQFILPALGRLTFQGFEHPQRIQFRTGYSQVKPDLPLASHFEKHLKNLRRQLETDIIEEY